jgi:hypothetical protein
MDNREIDKLVAEKVMGWKLENIPTSTYGSTADVWKNEAGKIMAYDREWKPTEDISSAWQVVLKVCEETRWYELTFRPTGAIANFLGNTIHRGIVPFKDAGNDRTRAQCMAICLAALEAVGVEVSQPPGAAKITVQQ